MNTPANPPKNPFKKTWEGFRGALFSFVLLAVAAFLVMFVIGRIAGMPGGSSEWAAHSLIIGLVIALVVVPGILFVRWLCCWRNLRRFLVVAACLITLVALIIAEEDARAKWSWNSFKRAEEAKGEKFYFAGVMPPPVPADQNFALTPIVFTTYGNIYTRDGKLIPFKQRDTNFVNRLQMPLGPDYNETPTNGGGNWAKATLTDLKPWQDYYRTLAAKTNFFPIAPQPQSPARDVLLALSKYDSTIEELRQASRLPYSRFPLDYENGPPFAILLPHLASLKSPAQVLELRAIAELQNGESDKALADVKLSLRLAEAVRTEPFLISHLVRIAVVAIATQPIYEGLAEHRWADAQLVELDSELAKLDFLADYEFSMRGERALGVEDIDYMRRTLDFSGASDAFGPSRPPNPVNHLMPSAFFYQNQLAIARMHQQWTLPMVELGSRTVSPESVRLNDMKATNTLNHFSPYNIFARMVFPAISKAVKRYTRAQSSVDLTRVAVALERYRLARGQYPASLDALSPQFIDKVPHDIIDGGRLKYRRTDRAFVLYSIGWNGKDDGGSVALTKNGVLNWDAGDWVWTYPGS